MYLFIGLFSWASASAGSQARVREGLNHHYSLLLLSVVVVVVVVEVVVVGSSSSSSLSSQTECTHIAHVREH